MASAAARALAGFVVGAAMGSLALVLTGAGHGTYVPIFMNASLLAFLPEIGAWIAVLGPPFLWALYLAAIPAIRREEVAGAATLAVVALHILPGIWQARGEAEGPRVPWKEEPVWMVLYLASFAAAAGLLVWWTLRHAREAPRDR